MDITGFSSVSNVVIKDLIGNSLYTKSSIGSFELDISSYDAINITCTAISGLEGSATFTYTLE